MKRNKQLAEILNNTFQQHNTFSKYTDISNRRTIYISIFMVAFVEVSAFYVVNQSHLIK